MNLKLYQFSKFLYLVPFFLVLSSYAQNNVAIADSLTKQLQSLPKNIVSDLVYLQTSKTIYETEEDLWFKGYVLDAQYFYPSARSKTLFVQLIEEKTNQVVWDKKYEIEDGFVDGHFFCQANWRKEFILWQPTVPILLMAMPKSFMPQRNWRY